MDEKIIKLVNDSLSASAVCGCPATTCPLIICVSCSLFCELLFCVL